MEEVYLLWFTCSDERLKDEEELLVGIYSTHEKAEEAMERVKKYNGFRDSPSGFEIHARKVDEDNWKAGFTIC